MYFNFRGGGVNFRLQAPDQVPVSTLCLSVSLLCTQKSKVSNTTKSISAQCVLAFSEGTALSGKLKWQKNIQSISRLLRERPHPGLRNEPPLDSLDPQSLNPFMASLWIGSGEGLAIKGFGD